MGLDREQDKPTAPLAYFDTNLEEAFPTSTDLNRSFKNAKSPVGDSFWPLETAALWEFKGIEPPVDGSGFPVAYFDVVNAHLLADDEERQAAFEYIAALGNSYFRQAISIWHPIAENMFVVMKRPAAIKELWRFLSVMDFLHYVPFHLKSENKCGLRCIIDEISCLPTTKQGWFDMLHYFNEIEKQAKKTGILHTGVLCSEDVLELIPKMHEDQQQHPEPISQMQKILDKRWCKVKRVNPSYDRTPKKIKPIDDYLSWWRKKLNDIENMEGAQTRGYAFENYLLALAHFHGCDCEGSRKTQLNRQVDGIIRINNVTFLVEAKAKKPKVGTEEFDNISSILANSSPHGTFGLACSLFGFKNGVIEKLAGGQSPLLSMNGRELKLILSNNGWVLAELLTMKRNQADVGNYCWILCDTDT